MTLHQDAFDHLDGSRLSDQRTPVAGSTGLPAIGIAKLCRKRTFRLKRRLAEWAYRKAKAAWRAKPSVPVVRVGRFHLDLGRHVTRLRRAVYYWLLTKHPASAFQLLGAAARVTDHWSFPQHCVSPEQVSAVLHWLSDEESLRVSRQIRSLHMKNLALFELLELRGFEALAPIVRIQGEQRLVELHGQNRPAILMGWHVGPEFGVVTALQRLGLRVLYLVLKSPKLQIPPGLDVCDLDGESNRIIGLKRAVSHLRSGGMVLIAGDGSCGEYMSEIHCMNRRVRMRKGPAVLARLTGAPVIPVAARWRCAGRRIDVTVHEPLAVPTTQMRHTTSFEDALMSEAARWFERHLRAYPDVLKAERLHEIAGEPVASLPVPGS